MNLGGGACSELRSCHCTPASETEQDSLSKTEKVKEKRIKDSLKNVYRYREQETIKCDRRFEKELSKISTNEEFKN